MQQWCEDSSSCLVGYCGHVRRVSWQNSLRCALTQPVQSNPLIAELCLGIQILTQRSGSLERHFVRGVAASSQLRFADTSTPCTFGSLVELNRQHLMRSCSVYFGVSRGPLCGPHFLSQLIFFFLSDVDNPTEIFQHCGQLVSVRLFHACAGQLTACGISRFFAPCRSPYVIGGRLRRAHCCWTC